MARIIREELILADKAILDAASWIKKVSRTLENYKSLKQYAGIQFPLAAVVGRLPTPRDYHLSEREQGSIVDQVTSSLIVEVNLYFMEADHEQIDIKISDYANTLFRLLFEDQTRNGLALATTVELDKNYAYWDPFGAFKLLITHTYNHSTGGI